MTEKPFVHKAAFVNMISNFIFHDEFIKIFKNIINEKGILNIGGKTQSIYNFARKQSKNVKKIYLKKNNEEKIPLNSSMKLTKLNKLLSN